MKKGIFLCVDDELMVLLALKDQLRKVFGQQHLIEAAQSADEALEILDEMVAAGDLPLVIISDWLMPGMRGDELLIEVHRRFPHVIKLMLSGQVDDAAIERVRQEANLHDFFSKPWDADQLIASLQKGLQMQAEQLEHMQLSHT